MKPDGVHARIAFRAGGLACHGPLRLDFGEPQTVLQARTCEDVTAVIEAADAAARAGAWVVGWLAYEAAHALDSALPTHPLTDVPLAWFGVHAAPLAAQTQAMPTPNAVRVRWDATPGDRSAFDAAVGQLRQAIEAGEIYQANHTARWHGELLHGSTLDLFEALRREQAEAYAAYIDTGVLQILSLSPELFFDWDGDEILTRPMKGTAPRGADALADAALAAQLKASAKERAENVMVVDLLRNDLSRVALSGSVQVPSLFDVQVLPTVLQMTSEVRARTRSSTSLLDLLRALFPCGSITGAPKRQAMKCIVQHETQPRGVYCGAVGVLRPGGGASFNVAIRSINVRDRRHLTLGVGSGITASSNARSEWREWHHKGAFALRAAAPFELLETLLLEDGRWLHADLHQQRMGQSARYFGYIWSPQMWQRTLQEIAQAHPQGTWRVRITADRDGDLFTTVQAMSATATPVRIVLAGRPLGEAHSPFVRHKTTRRDHYEAAEQVMPGVFDTLLWNDDGELTECTRGNIAVYFDGEGWLTPALDCGLLPGIGRQVALTQGRLREAILPVASLAQASELAFINSLRGWLPAVLTEAVSGNVTPPSHL